MRGYEETLFSAYFRLSEDRNSFGTQARLRSAVQSRSQMYSSVSEWFRKMAWQIFCLRLRRASISCVGCVRESADVCLLKVLAAS